MHQTKTIVPVPKSTKHYVSLFDKAYDIVKDLLKKLWLNFLELHKPIFQRWSVAKEVLEKALQRGWHNYFE